MTTRFASRLACAVACAAAFPAAHGDSISGTWHFSASDFQSNTGLPAPVDPVFGTFTFDGFDTTATYVDAASAGFGVSLNIPTVGSGGSVFSYDPADGYLLIGGAAAGAESVRSFPRANDWLLAIYNFATSPMLYQFIYAPTSVEFTAAVNFFTTSGSVRQAVPEPGTLGLLGLGLLGLGLGRRRNCS